MSTYNWLDLQMLGSQPVMLTNLPNHWYVCVLSRLGGCLFLSSREAPKTNHIRDFAPNLEKNKVVQSFSM